MAKCRASAKLQYFYAQHDGDWYSTDGSTAHSGLLPVDLAVTYRYKEIQSKDHLTAFRLSPLSHALLVALPVASPVDGIRMGTVTVVRSVICTGVVLMEALPILLPTWRY